MKGVLKGMKALGVYSNRPTPNVGPIITDLSQMGPDFHVPAPGRVQYYRADALPFVPHEIKCQLRFPKAYATSAPNYRYLDQVRQETSAFMAKNISQNYFTGETTIPLTATLGEAEVLFSAGSDVKTLAASGDLNGLHERVNNLGEASERAYLSNREKI